jgi:hypothetical protein
MFENRTPRTPFDNRFLPFGGRLSAHRSRVLVFRGGSVGGARWRGVRLPCCIALQQMIDGRRGRVLRCGDGSAASVKFTVGV